MLYFSIAVLFAGNKKYYLYHYWVKICLPCALSIILYSKSTIFPMNCAQGSLRVTSHVYHGVSNHQHYPDAQLNTSKLRFTGLCEGNPPMTGGSPHKGPFAFHYVIRSSFAHFCCGFVADFTHIAYDYFTRMETVTYQWCNPWTIWEK